MLRLAAAVQARERVASALLLPLPLSALQDAATRVRWMARVERLAARLAPAQRVALALLLLADVAPSAASRAAATAVEAFARRLPAAHAGVAGVEYALAERREDAPALAQALRAVAGRWAPPPRVVAVGLAELLEGALDAALARCPPAAPPAALQAAAAAAVARVRDELAAQRARARSARGPAAPEFADTRAGAAASDRDSDGEAQWDAAARTLGALADARLDASEPAAPLARGAVCDHFLARLAAFADRVLAARPSANVSPRALLALLSALLAPARAQLAREAPERLSARAAAAALPWRRLLREVYAAFFATLDDVRVAVPADWRARELLALESAPLAADAVAVGVGVGAPRSAPPAVARKSLKRSFGVALAAPEAADPRLEDPEVRALRREIARERAASARFQQLLRREVTRGGGGSGGLDALL